MLHFTHIALERRSIDGATSRIGRSDQHRGLARSGTPFNIQQRAIDPLRTPARIDEIEIERANVTLREICTGPRVADVGCALAHFPVRFISFFLLFSIVRPNSKFSLALFHWLDDRAGALAAKRRARRVVLVAKVGLEPQIARGPWRTRVLGRGGRVIRLLPSVPLCVLYGWMI